MAWKDEWQIGKNSRIDQNARVHQESETEWFMLIPVVSWYHYTTIPELRILSGTELKMKRKWSITINTALFLVPWIIIIGMLFIIMVSVNIAEMITFNILCIIDVSIISIYHGPIKISCMAAGLYAYFNLNHSCLVVFPELMSMLKTLVTLEQASPTAF